MRNRVLVALTVVVVALVFWRISRPPLTPEQQIRAQMSDLTKAVQDTSPRRIMQFLAPDFKWNNSSRAEVEKLIRQVCLGASRVEVTRTNELIRVSENEATASGHYDLRYHELQQASSEAPHTRSGDYSVVWQKTDGDWKIVAINGLESAPTSDSLF